MTGSFWRRLAARVVLLAAAAVPALAPAADAVEADGAQVVVKYKALGSLMREQRARGERGPQHAAAMGRRLGLALSDGRIVEGRTQVLRGERGISSAQLAARLAADAEVEYAVPDRRKRAMLVPNDTLFAAAATTSPVVGQWYLRAPDSTAVSAINAVAAWDITTGSSSIVVADLDTGVLFSHPDLANKLLTGYDFVTSSTTAGDGGGRDADATDPGDWVSAGQCGAGQAAESSSWHGTQTSGIIGAQSNNATGMASVGFNTMVLPVRVLGKCGGVDSDIVAAMLWAGGVSADPTVNPRPARVINLSLGGSGACSALYQDAVNQLTAAGVVVVAAAGNDEGLAVNEPANCSGVIAVAGVRHVGTKVGFSSIGPEVALSAPGGNCVNTTGACLYPIITATNNGSTTAAANTYSNGSNYSVGTSFATPMVAGTAALMLAANPALTPTRVKQLLMGSARAFPTTSTDPAVQQCRAPDTTVQDECICTTSTCGAGLLDAGAAVTAAAASATPTATISASATSVTLGTSVTLDGSGSSVPAGRTIASYRWAIASGGTLAAISGASNAATATVVTTGTGNFTAQLTVTDSLGSSASNSVTVIVNPPAAPTVAIVASNTTVAAGASVTFDGSGSRAASGLTVTGYQWAITSGAGFATLTSAANAATATVATAGNGSGSFTVRLTVTDSLGQSSSSTSTVNVTAVVPTANIVASGTSVNVGSTLTFDGSSSTAPSGRTITGYEWALASGFDLASISGSSTGTAITVATNAAGTVTVQLTVTDSAGARNVKTAQFTVNAPGGSGGSTGGGGGGGGGGATSPLWLALLAAATAALRRPASPDVSPSVSCTFSATRIAS